MNTKKKPIALLILGLVLLIISIAIVGTKRDTYTGADDSIAQSSELEIGRPTPSPYKEIKKTKAEVGEPTGNLDLLSFNQIMSKIRATDDPQIKLKMTVDLVAIHGKTFGLDILEFLKTYEPKEDARKPLLHLASDNASEKLEIFKFGLNEFAPGKNRSSLLRSALATMPKNDLIAMSNDLLKNGFKEDEVEISRLIKQQNLFGRQDFSQADLIELMTSISSKKISAAIAYELARREIVALGNDAALPPADAVISEIPSEFSEAVKFEFYSMVLSEPRTESVDELQDLGVPNSLLITYVKNMAGRQMGILGPARAVEDADGISGELREHYLRHIASRWISSDSLGASAAVLKMESGNDKDLMISEVIDFSIRVGDLDSAVEWANEVNDPILQAKMLQGINSSSAEN